MNANNKLNAKWSISSIMSVEDFLSAMKIFFYLFLSNKMLKCINTFNIETRRLYNVQFHSIFWKREQILYARRMML